MPSMVCRTEFSCILVAHPQAGCGLCDNLREELEVGRTRTAHGADDILLGLVHDDCLAHTGKERTYKLAILIACGTAGTYRRHAAAA